MSTAQISALSLPEILTSILLHLDITTLLLSQRVSRSWLQLIVSAPTLQQALFFTSDPSSHLSPVLNPLLVAKFPPWFTTLKEGIHAYSSFENLEWISHGEAGDRAWSFEKASWRHMLVVQPASVEMAIDASAYSREGSSRKEGWVRVDGGVRMGMLYDYIWNLVRRSIGEFGFDWRGVGGFLGDARAEVQGYAYDGEIFRCWGEKCGVGKGIWEGKIKLITRHTRQCVGGEPGVLMRRLKSDAWKDLDVKWEAREYFPRLRRGLVRRVEREN
ncbi:hypothetical protein NHQ30_005882 [Ciborinia camelliae]|nr:hypothetical protein NHQ30_005882 [Ciborinia camelliae]